MNATVEDLLLIIGEYEVKLRILEREKAKLEELVKSLATTTGNSGN